MSLAETSTTHDPEMLEQDDEHDDAAEGQERRQPRIISSASARRNARAERREKQRQQQQDPALSFLRSEFLFGHQILYIALICNLAAIGCTVGGIFTPLAVKDGPSNAQDWKRSIGMLDVCNVSTSGKFVTTCDAAGDVLKCRRFYLFADFAASLTCASVSFLALVFLLLATFTKWARPRKLRVMMFVLVFACIGMVLSFGPLLVTLLILATPEPCNIDERSYMSPEEGYVPDWSFRLQIISIVMHIGVVVDLLMHNAGESCSESLHNDWDDDGDDENNGEISSSGNDDVPHCDGGVCVRRRKSKTGADSKRSNSSGNKVAPAAIIIAASGVDNDGDSLQIEDMPDEGSINKNPLAGPPSARPIDGDGNKPLQFQASRNVGALEDQQQDDDDDAARVAPTSINNNRPTPVAAAAAAAPPVDSASASGRGISVTKVKIRTLKAKKN